MKTALFVYLSAIGLSAILGACSNQSSPSARTELYIKLGGDVECFYNGEIRFPNGVAVSSLESFTRYSLQVTPEVECTNSEITLAEIEVKTLFGADGKPVAIGVEADLENPNWEEINGEQSREFTAILPIQEDASISSLYTTTGDLAVRTVSLSVTFPNNQTIGGNVSFQ